LTLLLPEVVLLQLKQLWLLLQAVWGQTSQEQKHQQAADSPV